MTGRTHDLAAFTGLTIAFVSIPIPQMTIATIAVSIGANMIGGLFPDIDDQTADIWDKVRGGSVLGKVVKPLIGGHRMISHSIIGMWFVGFLLEKLLFFLNSILIVDMTMVWWAFMIGYVSHLITDSFTTQGVPWLFPLPIRFGFPPLKFLRIKTGGIIEKSLVFPGLLILNGYLFYTHYDTIKIFFSSYIQ